MQTFPNIGVDVAKDAVVVACAAQSFSTHSVTNQRTPLLAWLKSLPTGSRIGLESTGGYHELLADLAHAQGHVVFLLNPLDTKHYARAMGNRAKTDRVDAELIARLIAQEHTRLRPYTPPTADQRKLDRMDPAARQYRSHQKLAHTDDEQPEWLYRRTQSCLEQA